MKFENFIDLQTLQTKLIDVIALASKATGLGHGLEFEDW